MTFGQVPNLSSVLSLFVPILSVFGLGRSFLLALSELAALGLFCPSARLPLALQRCPHSCPLHFTCPILFVLPVNPWNMGLSALTEDSHHYSQRHFQTFRTTWSYPEECSDLQNLVCAASIDAQNKFPGLLLFFQPPSPCRLRNHLLQELNSNYWNFPSSLQPCQCLSQSSLCSPCALQPHISWD